MGIRARLRIPRFSRPLLPRRPVVYVLTACGVAILCLYLLAIGRHASGPPAARGVKETAVTVATVVKGPLESLTSLPGVVEPENQATLSAKTGGRVSWIGVKLGDSVKRGTPLLELDCEEVKAQLRQARGGLDAARANLARLLAGSRPEELKQAEAQLKQAEANLENARKDFERMKVLFEAGAVSEQQLDGARLKLSVAEAQHEVAVQQHLMAKGGPTAEAIQAARAQVEQAEGAVQLFESQLANARLISPIDGRVSMISPKVGEVVAPGVPLVSVTDVSNLYVAVGVPEKLIGLISTGQIVSVKVSSVAAEPFKGEITNIGPATDQRTKLFPVKIRLEETVPSPSDRVLETRLRPGMYAETLFPEHRITEALLIPARSVFQADGASWTYVVDERENVARLRKVEVKFTDGQTAAVTNGLREGEKVVTSGQQYLKDGARLVIREG